jgi:hypothetical protein
MKKNNHFSIDIIKLNHCLNAAKFTVNHLSKEKKKLAEKINKKRNFFATSSEINYLSKKLNISLYDIKLREKLPEYIIHSKKKIQSTKRAIRRDGIHFYNYYSLPSPSGFKSPVILDILCPADKLPKLNNGHLEQAITINLGKGDIYGRWGEKINKNNFKKIKSNNGKNSWIIGDTYVEPTFLPHTYSLAGKVKSQILSYTAKSQLQKFVDNSNLWPLSSYTNFLGSIDKYGQKLSFINIYLDNRGISASYLSKKIKVKLDHLNKFLSNKNREKVNNIKILKKVCSYLNIDYEIFLKKDFKEDAVGKTYLGYKESIKSIRQYKSYKVASMASSLRYPDLHGLFIKVSKEKKVFDLFDYASTHYLVTSGSMLLNINNSQLKIKEGDAIWMAPYCLHGFSGKGSLVKITNGECIDYLDIFEISKIYKPEATLRRVYQDLNNWGHEN